MDIDVTELLTDPDTGGAVFDVIRRREVVGSNGFGVVAEQLIEGVVGAIYPTGNNSLVREEAYSLGVDSIMVVTQFRLRMASAVGAIKFQPDLVVVNGERYIVKTNNGYTQYGAGFMVAECLGIAFNDEAPAPAQPAVGQMNFTDPAQSSLAGAISP